MNFFLPEKSNLHFFNGDTDGGRAYQERSLGFWRLNFWLPSDSKGQ